MSIKNIAVLTSGGDAPGMNALLHSIAQACYKSHIRLFGIKNGFSGLCQNEADIKQFSYQDIEPFKIRGGTWLGTSRCLSFLDEAIQRKAAKNLKRLEIDRLIVIGGEGSYKGAFSLKNMGMSVLCAPASIDNDVPNTDISIGFFSALESVLDALEKIRTTAAAHHRIFLVEIMGNACGDLTGLASLLGNCDYVIASTKEFSEEALVTKLKNFLQTSSSSLIVCIAEKICDVFELAGRIEQAVGCETRGTILGHTQRGGNANVVDRFFAIQIGTFAIERALASKNSFEILGLKNGQPTFSLDFLGKTQDIKPNSLNLNFFDYSRALVRTNL